MSREDVEVVRGLFTALDNQDWEAPSGPLIRPSNGRRQKARFAGLKAS